MVSVGSSSVVVVSVGSSSVVEDGASALLNAADMGVAVRDGEYDEPGPPATDSACGSETGLEPG